MILSPAPEKGAGGFYDGLFDAQGGIHREGYKKHKSGRTDCSHPLRSGHSRGILVNAKAVADHFQVSVSTAVERGVGLGLLKVW